MGLRPAVVVVVVGGLVWRDGGVRRARRVRAVSFVCWVGGIVDVLFFFFFKSEVFWKEWNTG